MTGRQQTRATRGDGTVASAFLYSVENPTQCVLFNWCLAIGGELSAMEARRFRFRLGDCTMMQLGSRPCMEHWKTRAARPKGWMAALVGRQM